MPSLILRLLLFVGLLSPALATPAFAAAWIERDGVSLCPAKPGDEVPPDFSGPQCREVNALEIDPQGAMLWIRATIRLDTLRGPEGEPLALFVSGKMASEIYLNGQLAGRNGRPGIDAASEVPGLMDVTLHPDPSAFRLGDNELVIRASSHHGLLRLDNPIHMVAIAPSGRLTDTILRNYWPSLLTGGIFVLGAIYFGVVAAIGPARKRAVTFALMCVFASGQLAAEIYRGIASYPYPVHDVRLIAILVFSAGFGLAAAYHVLSTLGQRHLAAKMGAILAATGVVIAVAPGFDAKAEYGMLVPILASLLAAGVSTYRGQRRAFVYFLALATFAAAILLFPSLFLDTVFFFLVAAFLLFLLVDQGVVLSREVRERARQAQRADRLALALDQARERSVTSEVTVSSAGKIDRVPSSQILFCRGAGGYTELVLADGREILHAATLAELENELPPTFLRVHRSFVVNSAFVQTLVRDAAGTGTLTLTTGAEVPVSRRIMPQVRQALA